MANNQILASDYFLSGSLAAGWTILPAGIAGATCKVVAGTPNVTEPTNINEVDGQYWSGLTWPNDQASEITLQALTAAATAAYIVLFVRQSSSANTSYQLNLSYKAAGPVLEAGLYVNVAGMQNQLGSFVTGLTYTADDVWTFQVAGSIITVYQNGMQIMRYADTQVTSGSPGYAQFAPVLADSKVSSWRGYSVVQQDGIWQKQGIVIPAASTDFSAGVGGQANASMLYEGNAQLLSGTVYKMWFSAGHPAAETNCYYAESSDGKNWTRQATSILLNYGSPFVIKNGSTYYMYVQPAASAGIGAFAVYTSSDGIVWSQLATNILTLGTSGAWDDTYMWYLQPVAIIAGTWYFVYCAGTTDTGYQLKLGLATSTDGQTLTKYAGNPVLTAANSGSVVNSAAVAEVNGTWYMWMFGMQPGQGNSVAPNLNPGEGVRYQTKDFKTWTNPVNSVHRSQLYEGVNYLAGQCYPNGIFNVGGKAYMYIQSATSDGVSPAEYQLSLAIGPAPISSIVTGNEDAVQQVATDNFMRGDGSLGANWTTPTGGTALKIASDLCEATALSACIAAYTGAGVIQPNQYSEITITTLTSPSGMSPIVRAQLGSIGYYVANLSSAGVAVTAAIYKNVAGTLTQIGGSSANQKYTVKLGDVFRLTAVTGSDGNPILTVYQNGFQILQVEDYSNAFPTGYPGIYANPTTNINTAQASLWAGGNANVIPAYPSSGGNFAGYGTDISASTEFTSHPAGEINSNRTSIFGTNRGSRIIG